MPSPNLGSLIYSGIGLTKMSIIRTGISTDILFGKKFGIKWDEPYPIIYEGKTTSNAGILSVIRICKVMSREVKMEEPRAHYRRGWGTEAAF